MKEGKIKILVSKHAKKRLKQRVNKAWRKTAEIAFRDGVDSEDVEGGMKGYLDWTAYKSKSRYANEIESYKIYFDHLYLYGKNNTLVTVLLLPRRFRAMAEKLTRENKMPRYTVSLMDEHGDVIRLYERVKAFSRHDALWAAMDRESRDIWKTWDAWKTWPEEGSRG